MVTTFPMEGAKPTGTVKFESFRPRKSYSSLAVQLGAKPHSTPAPANQPVVLLLFERLIELLVDTLVRVGLLTPTQPPPPLA